MFSFLDPPLVAAYNDRETFESKSMVLAVYLRNGDDLYKIP